MSSGRVLLLVAATAAVAIAAGYYLGAKRTCPTADPWGAVKDSLIDSAVGVFCASRAKKK